MSDTTELALQIHQLVSPCFLPDAPGAAILAVRGDQVIFRQAYGMANLELGVHMQPEMIFRLGSITKQFTAVSILMLLEEGKLSLDDPVTRFLPDFPAHDAPPTIRHLLTHTSGIVSFTDLTEFLTAIRTDLPLAENIALFKDKPQVFPHGERWAYNNSGFVLLSAVIEAISGLTYAQFLAERIFSPLGMAHTSYDFTEQIMPHRVPGYTRNADGWANAAFMSMTLPLGAGALVSCVDDLAKWNAALLAGKVLRGETLEQAFAPCRLNDGSLYGYGFGWGLASYEGSRIVEHGGGINGFVTFALSMPAEQIFVAILTNSETGESKPGQLAFKIAALLLGKPYQEPPAITLSAEDFAPCRGVYELRPGCDWLVFQEEGQYFFETVEAGRGEILPCAVDEFFFKDDSLHRLRFIKNEAGQVERLEASSRFAIPQCAVRTERPLPSKPAVVAVEPAVLQACAGVYEIGPGFTLAITVAGDHLLLLPTGQPALDIFPASNSRFFALKEPVALEFLPDEQGRPQSMVVTSGPRQFPARRSGSA